MEGQLHGQELLAGISTLLEALRLSHLSQSPEEVFLERLVRQIRELSAEIAVRELLHMPLVVTGDFLAFDALVEEVTVEFTHQTEASAHKVAILLGEQFFGVLRGVKRRVRQVDCWDRRI